MPCVEASDHQQDPRQVSAALCVDTHAFQRFAPVLRHLAVGLADEAVEVRILSADPRLESMSLGPVQTVLHQPIAWPVARRRLDQLIEVLAARPPTVVHAFSCESYALAGEIAQSLDIDLVLQVTGPLDCEPLGRPRARPVDAYIAFTTPLVRTLEDRLNIPPELVNLVHPGVLCAPEPACFSQIGRETTLLCMSPLERDTGVDHLLRAVRLLRRNGTVLQLFLWGRGPAEHALRHLAAQLELTDCVTFVSPMGDPVNAMQGADIFVRPGADRVFSAATLQAMGAGLAVVAAANPFADYLHHGETALVCESPGPESFAEALHALLQDRMTARRLATAGREYVRAHHTLSAMASRTAAVYRQIAMQHATFTLPE